MMPWCQSDRMTGCEDCGILLLTHAASTNDIAKSIEAKLDMKGKCLLDEICTGCVHEAQPRSQLASSFSRTQMQSAVQGLDCP